MSTEKFEYLGVNHVALVCKDMKETVDFYPNVLEMPYVERLEQKGVRVHVINHADNDKGYEVAPTEATWVRSVYFQDPSGIALELAAYTRAFRSDDVAHAPATYPIASVFLPGAKPRTGIDAPRGVRTSD
jgi:catechol 2,3-dioxygenase-like lactoylglutathione lyase family enzyme